MERAGETDDAETAELRWPKNFAFWSHKWKSQA